MAITMTMLAGGILVFVASASDYDTGPPPGEVDITATIEPAPPITFGGSLSIQTNTFIVKLTWTDAQYLNWEGWEGHYEVSATNPEWGTFRSHPYSPYVNPADPFYNWYIFGNRYNDPDPTGCTWTFKVYAYRSIGKEGPEATKSVFIPGAMSAAPALNTDGDLDGGNSVTVTWGAPPERTTSEGGGTTPVKGYTVVRETSDDMVKVFLANVTGTSYTDYNVTAGKTYYYTIYPYDQYGNGKSSLTYITLEAQASNTGSGSTKGDLLGLSSTDLMILAGVVISGVVVVGLAAVLMMRKR